MDGLEIRLLGEVVIRRDGHPLPALPAKAKELLCFLLVNRERMHTREVLAEVLWPHGDPRSSKGYLRQALWKLNATMRGHTDQLLIVDTDRVRVAQDAVWLDIHAFEQAKVRAGTIRGRDLSAEQARELTAATGLYRGELLATSCYDWCGQERDRLLLIRLAMLEQLMDYCDQHRLFAAGIGHGETVLRHDPARETTHRRLMRLNYRAGDRTSAIRQYERCVTAMHDEFGVRPSAQTTALYEQIRADRLARSDEAAANGADRQPVVDAHTHPDLHRRLDQIQAGLATVLQALRDKRPWQPDAGQVARNGSTG